MKKLIILLSFCLLITITASAQIIKGNYAIKNVQTGMLLRIKDANTKTGTPIVAYNPENWKCMTWDFKHVEGNTYQLRNLLSSKTFMPAGKTNEGVTLEEQPIDTANYSQQYQFEPIGKNIYLIKLKGTDLYITPSDGKGSVNSQIILSTRSGDKLQQWVIYQQSPSI